MIRSALMMSVLTGATIFAGTAQAQFYWAPLGPRPPIVDDDYFRRPPGRIPAPYADVEDTYNSGEVIGILREEGFRSISRPRRSGEVYVATAVDRTGMRVRVVVGAYDGDIRSVTAIGPEKPAQPRVARTPDPSAIPVQPADPSANPLNGGGSAGAPPAAQNPRVDAPRNGGQKPQPNLAGRPAPAEMKPVEPRTPNRVILPNPSEGPNTVAPPTVAPSQALAPPPAIATPPAPAVQPPKPDAPQIATPAVPPVPAPEIAAPKTEIVVPAVPATPPVVVAPSEPKPGAASTETLPLPPTTSQ